MGIIYIWRIRPICKMLMSSLAWADIQIGCFVFGAGMGFSFPCASPAISAGGG